MAEAPWLTVMGVGEDGPAGLSPACQEALAAAEVIMGPPRHLDLLPEGLGAERRTWPVPFAEGLPQLDTLRGRQVVVLASGDPLWFGAGSVLAKRFARTEWRALPGVSAFSLMAAALGWPLEHTLCLGLHAAPLTRLRPHLAPGQRIIVLLRDGDAVGALGRYLSAQGFGASHVTVGEALGGPRQRLTETTAEALENGSFAHPVLAAIEVAGHGTALSRAAGLPDDLFAHDGQITKRQIRALTLSALAPRAGEHLWDIGGGAGSVAIEWLLAHPGTAATSIEAVPERAARITENAVNLGVDRLEVMTARAPDGLARLAPPDAIFIGGGLSDALLSAVTEQAPSGARLVANAVTLEAEALLTQWADRKGGSLSRIALSQATPLGGKRAWKAGYPIVQWSVTL